MLCQSTNRILFTLTTALLISASNANAQSSTQSIDAHEVLAGETGVWDAESKLWLSPNANPISSTAIETNTMLGDLWLLSEYKSEIAGEEFSGRGQFGYDPIAKKYIGTWIDSMSPYLSVIEGTFDSETNTLTMMSKSRDPQTGNESVSKMVSIYEDDDHKTFEMYMPGDKGDDSWWKMMEVKYTRRK